MGTRWRADGTNDSRHLPRIQTSRAPNMPPTSSSTRHRPQIYVHFEFGVSWTERHPPRPHAVTYMSRTMRERAHHYPRHLPPANTNFLVSAQQRSVSGSDPETRRHRPAQQQQQHGERRRHSRQSSRSSHSHERGSSAPPPFNDSPWDAEPEPLSASVLPPRPQAHVWKDLPAIPSQFRLGEDGLPWTAWTWPGGYHDDDSEPPAEPNYGSNVAGPSTSSPTHDGDGRQRELESLSAAMMTVDNGFEDQWWFQGPRLNVAGDLHVPTSTRNTMESVAVTPGSVGWAVATEASRAEESSPAAYYISPLTASATPGTAFAEPPMAHLRLSRTMTTRSEELFLPASASTLAGPTL